MWDGFLEDILKILATAAVTTAGTLWVTSHRAKNEKNLRAEELERHARYLAIRVVCSLDPFISQCCDVVQDTGTEDEDGNTSGQIGDPVLSLPDDVDWKTIQPDLNRHQLARYHDSDAACISAEMRATVPVPTPRLLATFKMPVPEANAFRTAFSRPGSIRGLPIGFPDFVPFRLARATPERTRSRIIDASNSAKTPSI